MTRMGLYHPSVNCRVSVSLPSKWEKSYLPRWLKEFSFTVKCPVGRMEDKSHSHQESRGGGAGCACSDLTFKASYCWPLNFMFLTLTSFQPRPLQPGLSSYVPSGGLVTKGCPTLATPWTVACQAPDRTVACQAPLAWIFQTRILEWVVISFSSGSSQPRD